MDKAGSTFKFLTSASSISSFVSFGFIESVRLGLYFFTIFTSILSQIINPYFINFNIWIPIYIVVIIGLAFHFFVTLTSAQFTRSSLFQFLIFCFDVIFISSLGYFTYLSYPIFSVLYLVNIFLCSIVLGSTSSFVLAGISSVFYTFVLLSRSNDFAEDQVVFVLNILSFYITAFVSGFLGDLLSRSSTELKKTKSEFYDLKNLSETIVKNISVGLVTFESDKEISFANESAKKIVGPELKSSSLIFKETFEFLNGGSTQNSFRKEYEVDVAGIKKNLELISTFLPSEDMNQKWIILIQDLTEIKSLQKELQLKDKLAAIGQLAGGIAHEIRNPLASISGSVEMLKETTKDLNPENTKLFSIIIKEIDRLNLLITDFLSFVRPEVKKTDDVKINDLINEIFILLKNDHKLIGKTKIELDLADIKIKCDRSKLKQALLNIITNAFQAMNQQDSSELICRVSKEGFFISIEVTDNGPGMSTAVLNRIFEPFYTTKDKGTGLGLAITHRIIEGHEGTLKVFSELKKGTTFFIRLPIH